VSYSTPRCPILPGASLGVLYSTWRFPQVSYNYLGVSLGVIYYLEVSPGVLYYLGVSLGVLFYLEVSLGVL